jgi:large subunit ribosomal protein L4
MIKISIHNMQGKSVGDLSFDDSWVVQGRGTQAVHDAVVAFQANQRAGSASTLTKGEVAGSNKKPWKQKGTGRARAGFRQSPIWRGGGVVFGPKPRKYNKDMPRKVARLALRRVMTDKFAANEIVVVDKFEIAEAKTKSFVAAMAKLKVEGKALIVLDTIARDVALASRNVPGIEITTAANVNTMSLLRFTKIIFSQPALEQLKKRLTAGESDAS